MTSAAAPAVPASVEAPFYPVATSKFIVMSICTLGLYEAYWAYKCWKRIRSRSSESLSPIWRAFFGHLYSFYLFARVRDYAKQNRVAVDWSAGWLGVVYLVVALAWRAPGVLGLIGLLGFVPFLPVLRTAHAIRRSGRFRERVNDEFTVIHFVACIPGGAVVLMAVIYRVAVTLGVLPLH